MVFVPAYYLRLLVLLVLLPVAGGCGSSGVGGTEGRSSRFLIGSNSDGTLTTFYATADGPGIKPAAYIGISSRSVESVTPHPNGKVIYALADDRVQTLKVDPVTGELTLIGTVVTGGGGFRLLLVDDKNAYVVNKISASVSQYQINPTDFTLVRIGTSDAPVEAEPAAIVSHPGGLFVFVINRFAGTMSIFVRDKASGLLLHLANEPTFQTSQPTDIAFSADGRTSYISFFSNVNNQNTIQANLWLRSIPAGDPRRGQQWMAFHNTGQGTIDIETNAAKTHLYTANSKSDDISVFSAEPILGLLTELQTVPAGLSPSSLWLDESNRRLYATNANSSDVSVFDVGGDGTLTPRSRVQGRASVHHVAGVSGALVTETPRFLLAPDDLAFHQYDVNLTPLGSTPVSFGIPLQVAVGPWQRFAYSANLADDPGGTTSGVQSFRYTATSARMDRVSVKIQAQGAEVLRVVPDRSGRYLYALGRRSAAAEGVIYRFLVDAAGGLTQLIPDTVTGAGPEHMVMHPAGRYLYVANSADDTVGQYSVDGETGALLPLLAVTPGQSGPALGRPVGLAFHPEGRHLYVALEDDRAIVRYVIDGAIGALGSPISMAVPTGGADNRPLHLAAHPNGDFLYATDWGGDLTIYAINPTDHTLTVVASQHLAGHPGWIEVDSRGTALYLTVDGGSARLALDADGLPIGLPQVVTTGSTVDKRDHAVTVVSTIN